MASRPVIKAIVWGCLSSWYYGYHITELNYPVNGLTCYDTPHDGNPLLPACLGLDAIKYSAVTAMLTAGGLIGSALSDRLVRREGLAGGISWTGWINLAGAMLMASAPHWLLLAFGRFVSGLACGLAVCMVPPYLAHIVRTTPQLASRSGQIGTLHQLAIVLGICSSQVVGLILTGPRGDKPGAWRYVCAFSGLASILQIAISNGKFDDTETPRDPEAHPESPSSPMEAGAPLLGPSSTPSVSEQLTIRDLLSSPSLRRPTIIVTSLLCMQQLSGVNAVLFYSTPVMHSVLKNAGAGVLSVGITVVNALMTLPAIALVDKVGRRTLFLLSAAGMLAMSVLLGYGLDNNRQNLSGFAIVAFIAAFAIGLGPVPFLLISEMVPPHAVPALSSLALSASWITTFIVAMGFIPLRDLLSDPVDPHDPMSPRKNEGRVFYVFTVSLSATIVLALRGIPKK